MAVRQYIGARYVPKIYGAWRSGISYEPLTIVTYLNRSFTSKMTVPATVGNPADNDQFWVETGAYNAQVAAVQDSVDSLSSDLAAYESRERHIVIIADSYGTHNGAGAGYEVAYNILDRLYQYLQWQSTFLHYSAVNGAGFCNGSFLSQLNAIDTDGADEAVKDIYVIGGWNDENGREGVSENNFDAAATAFRSAAWTKFPNARIHLCFAAWSYQSSRTQQDLRTTRRWYIAQTKKGFIFENNYQWVMHNSSLLIGGNVHPNQNGVDALADALAQLILKGECHVFHRTDMDTSAMTLPGTLPASASITVRQMLIDGNVTIAILPVRGCITLTESMSVTCDGNHGFALITASDGPTIVKGYGGYVLGACTATVYDGDTPIVLPGNMRIIDGVYTFCPDYYPTGSTYRTISGVTKVSVPSCSFTSLMPY